ncbi:hypothetical protein KCU81_g2962, partial [Aureobasidium melanogenum]|uniref:Cell wall protein PhiA n=1 Tax=Aureobasidium melanogenum (strain CBS 110374) TaxID=1043003 RepID=A0A074VDJ3_AURM1
MKFTITNTIGLLAAASSTLAAPLEARHDPAKPFTLDISFSNSPLSGPIQASGGSFWIGKNASTSCPSNVNPCPAGNSTSFTSSGNGLLYLNTEVPGGQQVYIRPDGLLTYTQPHSASAPSGSTFSGFEISPQNQMAKFYDFWLCSEDATDKAYRIWLEYRDSKGAITQNGKTGKNACTLVNLLASDVKKEGPAAWEYN